MQRASADVSLGFCGRDVPLLGVLVIGTAFTGSVSRKPDSGSQLPKPSRSEISMEPLPPHRKMQEFTPAQGCIVKRGESSHRHAESC